VYYSRGKNNKEKINSQALKFSQGLIDFLFKFKDSMVDRLFLTVSEYIML
jgi:hypothetical protein